MTGVDSWLMKVPHTLVSDLSLLVARHFEAGGLYGSPADMGFACGEYVRGWLSRRVGGEYQEPLDEAALCSWAERYGKHLGEFFLTEGRV